MKDKEITKGEEKVRKLGYKGGESLMRVFGNLLLKHHIFTLVNPLEMYALFFVFWYKCPLLYSWMEKRLYPSICNGGKVFSRNVFARYPLRSLSDGKGYEMMYSKGVVYEKIEGEYMDWEDKNDIPRSVHTPLYISQMIWRDVTHGSIEDYPDAGIFYRTYAQFERLPDGYIPSMDGRMKDNLNMRPFEGSLLVDMRARIRRDEEERLRDTIGREEKGDVSGFLEKDTHFFDCRLLPVDIDKVLHVSQTSKDPIVTGLSSSLLKMGKTLSPHFQYWLWVETWRGTPDSAALHRLGGIVGGWDARSGDEDDGKIVYEGEILPLEIILWKKSNHALLWSYRQYVKTCLREKRPINDAEFIGTPHFSIDNIPSWYLIHIGARKPHEIPPSYRNIIDAVADEKYDYVEAFIRRGDVKHIPDLGKLLGDFRLFKIIDKHLQIPYERMSFMAMPLTTRRLSDTQRILYNSLMDAARINTPILMREKEIRRDGVRVISADIVNYLVEGGRLPNILPLLEVRLGDSRYVKESLEARLDYMWNLLEGANQHNSLKLGQAACVCQIVSEMLDYGDRSRTQIQTDKKLASRTEDQLRIITRDKDQWLTIMFDYIVRLSGVGSDLMGLAATIASPEIVRLVLQLGGKGEFWKMTPDEILSIFINGWGDSLKGTRTTPRNVGVSVPMLIRF